jgi:iron complex outermembrane receptor protein
MTTVIVAATPRPHSAKPTGNYVLSAAIAAALACSVVPHRTLAADAGPAASGGEALGEITVTGSRIQRPRDLEAPSPIVTLDKDIFENSSASGAEVMLNQQPQFVPQNTQFTSGVQNSPTNTPGSATLNLRGLGSNRNLVLVDGRRAQPGNATLAVDINTIPLAAIQNVETITGGASAVYGPDAMAGVVNFVLKKNFQGLDVDVQRGETFHSDGAETRVSALMGLNGADDKGNVMVGLDFTKREAVHQFDRDWYRNGALDPGNASGGFIVGPAFAPTAGNQPSQAALNSLFPQAPAGTVTPSTQVNFNADGTPFVQKGGLGYNGPINQVAPGRYSGIRLLTNGSSAGQLDQAFTDGYLSVPLERHTIFGRGTYNFNDNVSAFVQMNYSDIDVKTRGTGYAPAITIWQTTIPRYANDATYLPAALETLLNSRPNPAAPWSLYQSTDFLGPESADVKTDVWQMLAGLKGNLPFQDWTWEIYGSRGNTHTQSDYTGLPSLNRLQYLEALPNFGQGASISSPAGTPFGYGVSCPSGLPVFQQFTPSALCVQSIQDPMKNESDLRQNIIEANLQGLAFNLPAGGARFDLGATYRSEDYSFSPGNPVADFNDNPVGLFPSNYTAGSTNVKEAYVELLVPIVKNLDAELGYRLSDFNTAGNKSTYKALFTWKALDQVSFRGGYQAATRAPNIAELYTGPTQSVVSFPQEDPCSSSTLSPWGNVASNPNRAKVQALCEALIGNTTSEFNTQTFNPVAGPNGWTRQVPTFFPLEIEVTTGNPKVKPETGKTWTLGAVINAPFGVEHLTATIDAYRIDISNTISPTSSITTYNTCFNSDGKSNPTYDVTNPSCQLISRNPITGDRASVTALYSNLGTLLTQGVDASINWSHDLGPGTIALGSTMNYLNKFVYQTSPTSALVDARGTLDPYPSAVGQGGQFDYRILSHVNYAWNGLAVGLNWEHLPSVRDASASLTPNTTVEGVKAYNLFALSSSYTFGRYSVRFGIDNLFDKDPPVVGYNPGVTTAASTTNTGFYDPLGRRYYVGMKGSF